MKTIVMAYGGESTSAAAFDAACDIACRSGSALHFVHVWGDPFRDVLPPVSHPEVEQALAESVGSLLSQSAAASGVSEVHVHTPRGITGRTIVKVAQRLRADLIVMGGRNPGVFAELITARVTREVLRRSETPVLVVPASAKWPPKRVVFGFDGSPESHAAAHEARLVAGLLDLELFGVWVTPLSDAGEVPVERLAEQFIDDVEMPGEETSLQASVLKGKSASRMLVKVSSARHGEALLALGLEHRLAPGTTPHPSTAMDAVMHARVPTLLVPATRAPAGAATA